MTLITDCSIGSGQSKTLGLSSGACLAMQERSKEAQKLAKENILKGINCELDERYTEDMIYQATPSFFCIKSCSNWGLTKQGIEMRISNVL